jgi:hypothetical protein
MRGLITDADDHVSQNNERRFGARSKVPHPGQIPILQAADIVITNLSKMLGV